MNSSTSETTAESERKDRAVLCSKCEHLNAWGRNECKRCGARLYISCSDCGHRCERVRTRCSNCSRRLHHTLFERLIRVARHGPVQITGMQVLVFCAGISLAFLLILFFSRLELPRLF